MPFKIDELDRVIGILLVINNRMSLDALPGVPARDQIGIPQTPFLPTMVLTLIVCGASSPSFVATPRWGVEGYSLSWTNAWTPFRASLRLIRQCSIPFVPLG